MGAGLGEGEIGSETGRVRLGGGERLVGSEAGSGTEQVVYSTGLLLFII